MILSEKKKGTFHHIYTSAAELRWPGTCSQVRCINYFQWSYIIDKICLLLLGCYPGLSGSKHITVRSGCEPLYSLLNLYVLGRQKGEAVFEET